MAASCSHIAEIPYRQFSQRFQDQAVRQHIPLSGTIELTWRCNNSCAHCYCNLPANEPAARSGELSCGEWDAVIDQLVDMGCLWLLFTGGEPLLHPDFSAIWRQTRQKGVLSTLFTNGTLLTPAIIELLQECPPFNLEITLYGSSQQTYEAVSRVPGSYARCMGGIELLKSHAIPFRLKAMVLRQNTHELPEMKSLAQRLGVDFRFDAMVNPRNDGGKQPCRSRLSPKEIVDLDMADPERLRAMQHFCATFMQEKSGPHQLYECGAGLTSFAINPYGRLQICGMVTQPSLDLRNSPFSQGWQTLFPAMRSRQLGADCRCCHCNLLPLCPQCPGWAMTEHGNPEEPVEFLCQVTALRAQALGINGETPA